MPIRSSTLASSYSSGTLSISKPAGMVSGDFLVVFLVAMGVHWGGYYQELFSSSTGTYEVVLGNPPLAPVLPSGGYTPSGPSLPTDYPHQPPVAILSTPQFKYRWNSGAIRGYFGNYWSNLGMPNNDGTYTTSGLGPWPFQQTWAGPANLPWFGNVGGLMYSNVIYSITAVGRTVDGSESSTLSFTLNNPLDSEYDYRALALCFEPTDWSGNNWDNPDPDIAGGTGDRYLDGATWAWWPATGSRSLMPSAGRLCSGNPNGTMGTFYAQAPTGPYTFGASSDLDGSLPRSHFSSWPPPAGNYADPSNAQASLPAPPLETNDDVILHLLAYAAPTSFGDPSLITVADLSATPHVDPLPVLHSEAWTKGSSSLLVRLSNTTASANHATDADGTRLVVLTTRVVSPAGPITPATFTADPNILSGNASQVAPPQDEVQALGLALTFRVRAPYVSVLASVPSRLATIVG